MKTRASAALGLAVFSVSVLAQSKAASCVSAVVEGEVAAGKSYEQVFTPRLKFLLEPMASGWIVRILAVGAARGPHDYAELATPPYRSVTPLAVSTDFSFRAQDAVGWNPRRFRYAASAHDFEELRALYDPVMRGDAKAASALTRLVGEQPEAELTILDAQLVPGKNDQGRMAAVVSSHFEATPHSVESTGASALGRITWMKFRVALDLGAGVAAAKGIGEIKKFCATQPTTRTALASQLSKPARKK